MMMLNDTCQFQLLVCLLLCSKSNVNVYGGLLQILFDETASHINYEIYIKQGFIFINFLYNVKIILFANT